MRAAGAGAGCALCGRGEAPAGSRLQLPEMSQLSPNASSLLNKLSEFKQYCDGRNSVHDNFTSQRKVKNHFSTTNILHLNICAYCDCSNITNNNENKSWFKKDISCCRDNTKLEGDKSIIMHIITHRREELDSDVNGDKVDEDNIELSYEFSNNNETSAEFGQNNEELNNKDEPIQNGDESSNDNDLNDELSNDMNDEVSNDNDMNEENDNSNELDNETVHSDALSKDYDECTELEQKKPYFEKIVLSLEEQKAVLEKMRKENKYLEATFKCHSCALVFVFQDSYQSHMVRHEESNGRYKCVTCGLRFATQAAHIMHRVLHSELHRCSECQEVVTARKRKRHETNCWRQEEEVTCEQCGSTFQDVYRLQQHLRRMHAVRKKFPCNLCSKSFNDSGGLRIHTITHMNRRFLCKLCPSSFKNPYELNRHTRQHAAPASAYCEPCGAWFKSNKTLRAHIRSSSHHTTETFDCEVCGRACSTKQSLKGHMQARHTLEPSYACHLCTARYTSRNSLLRHVKGHTVPSIVETAVCHLCGKGFKGQNRLNRHLREVCERKDDRDVIGTALSR